MRDLTALAFIASVLCTADLFFKAPGGRWDAGAYRLVLNHEQAKAELPIRLE